MAPGTGFQRSLSAVRRVLPRGQTLPEEVWHTRHVGILVLLWLHAGFIPAFALARGFGPLHAVLEGAIVPVAAVLATARLFPRRTRTAVASLGLLSSSAVLVHLSGGVIEMHFHFFVMVAVVALYQDWIPFLAAIAYVFVHHGLMGALDPDSVYNHMAATNNPWKWAGIHAFFVTGISLVCLVTWRLNEMMLDERRRAEDRLALLAEAGRILTSSLEVDAVLRRLSRLVAPSIAEYCAIALVEGNDLRDVAGRAFSRVSEALVAEVVRSGEPRVVTGADHTITFVVPMIGRDQLIGVLAVGTSPRSAHLGDDDLPFVEELARRAAVAVDNARLYSRQRSVAETLQHSLLPQRLPRLPGLATAAGYMAGGPGVEVGGDWYDVIQLPSGCIGFVMGDVVGRGEQAASLMGQLRNALRAYAFDGKAPSEIVHRLNRLLSESGTDHMATLVYAVLDPETGALSYVNAGHPPPLLVSADKATTTFLRDGSGLPIGALPTSRYNETRVVLAPSDTLVLYTDGLVENRSDSIEVGLHRLAEAVVEAPDDLDGVCTYVVEQALGGRDAHDDAAMLAVRLLPLGPRVYLHLPTDPSILPALRATLRRWLADAGANEQETYELLVACGEACTNAIRHATGPRSGRFDIELERNDEIRICVRDHGSWKEPRSQVGGRGLSIVEAYVDSLDIVKGLTGTAVHMRRRLAAAEPVAGVS